MHTHIYCEATTTTTTTALLCGFVPCSRLSDAAACTVGAEGGVTDAYCNRGAAVTGVLCK